MKTTHCKAQLQLNSKPPTQKWWLLFSQTSPKVQPSSLPRVNQSVWLCFFPSGSSPSDLTVLCWFESVPQRWLVHVQRSLRRGATRTVRQLAWEQRWGLTVCRQQMLRGLAVGGSAAGPELPSLDKCCKLDGLEPGGEKNNKILVSLHFSFKLLLPTKHFIWYGAMCHSCRDLSGEILSKSAFKTLQNVTSAIKTPSHYNSPSVFCGNSPMQSTAHIHAVKVSRVESAHFWRGLHVREGTQWSSQRHYRAQLVFGTLRPAPWRVANKQKVKENPKFWATSMKFRLATERMTQRWVTGLLAESVGSRLTGTSCRLPVTQHETWNLNHCGQHHWYLRVRKKNKLIAALSNCSPHFHICITTWLDQEMHPPTTTTHPRHVWEKNRKVGSTTHPSP